MALYISPTGVKKEIDLNLDSKIRFWGEFPIPCTELQISSLLGIGDCGEYECKRLPDGRLLFYFQSDDGVSASILLTQNESCLIATLEEEENRKTNEENYSAEYIEQAVALEYAPLIEYFSSMTDEQILSLRLFGNRLLIVLLFAKKCPPLEVHKRTGLSANIFLEELKKMNNEYIIS